MESIHLIIRLNELEQPTYRLDKMTTGTSATSHEAAEDPTRPGDLTRLKLFLNIQPDDG